MNNHIIKYIQLKPPEGWDREKVSQMAHEAREKRMADAVKKFEFDWKRMIQWIFHDRLAIVMIIFNACLVAYFYTLFTEGTSVPKSEEESDEEVVRITGPSSEGKTALHDFFANVFNRHHQSGEKE